MSLPGLAQPSYGLWAGVWKLLRLRLLIFSRGFRRAKTRKKILLAFLALLFLGFLGLIFFISWQILRFLQKPELLEITGDLVRVFEAVPVLMMSGAFLGVFLTSFGVLLQALYLSGDMDFLLSTPVPIRAVFIAKLLQAILPNFTLICLFALPVLYGLAVSNHYTLLYYPLVLVVLSALALAAAGLSSLLVMAVVRVFPARRVAELLGFFGAIFSILCSQSGNLAQFGNRYNNISGDQARQALAMLERVDTPWLPLAWGGQGLIAIGRGEWVKGLGLTGLTLVLAGGIFFVSLITAERLYYNGWASLQNQGRKRKAHHAVSAPSGSFSIRAALTRASHWLPAPMRAVIGKDWLVLRRDLRNLSQLVTPMIFGIMWAIMMLSGDSDPFRDNDIPTWLLTILNNVRLYSSVGLSLFVGWMLLGRLAGMGFAQEGKSYWLLKTAPIRSGQLILSKFLVAFLPAAGLSLIYLVGVFLMQKTGPGALLYAMLCTTLAMAGNTGLNLAFGIAGANLAWQDPRQMQRTSASCLGALATMIFIPIAIFLFFTPAVLFEVFGLPTIAGQATGLVMGGVLSLIVMIVPLLLVQKKIDQLGE